MRDFENMIAEASRAIEAKITHEPVTVWVRKDILADIRVKAAELGVSADEVISLICEDYYGR